MAHLCLVSLPVFFAQAEAEDIAADQKARAAVTAGKERLHFLHEAMLQTQEDAATAAARAEAEGALISAHHPTLEHASPDGAASSSSFASNEALKWRVPADFYAKDAADAAAALAVLASTVVNGGADYPPTSTLTGTTTSDSSAPSAPESMHARVASSAAKTTALAAVGAAHASADTALGTAARLVALIRARDSIYRCSPLGWAVKGGHEATCVWLVQHGALHEGPSAVRPAAKAPDASLAAKPGTMTPSYSYAGASSSRPSSSSTGRAGSASAATPRAMLTAAAAIGATSATGANVSTVNPRRPWTTGPQPSLATAYQEHSIATAAETPPLEPSPLLPSGYTSAATSTAALGGAAAGVGGASRAGTATKEKRAPSQRSTLLPQQQQPPEPPPPPQPTPGRELWGHVDPALVRRDLFPDPLQPLQPSQLASQQAKVEACRRAVLNDAKEACRRHANWQSLLVAAVVLSQRAKTQPKMRAAIIAYAKAQAEARAAMEAKIAKKTAKEARRERRASTAATATATSSSAENAESDDQALNVKEESHTNNHKAGKSPDKEKQASPSKNANKKPPLGRFSSPQETKVAKPYWLPPSLYLLGGESNSYGNSDRKSDSTDSSSPDYCSRDRSTVVIWEQIASFAGVPTGRRLRDAREVLAFFGREIAMHERGGAAWKRPQAYGTSSYLLQSHHGGWRSDDDSDDDEGGDESESENENGFGEESNLLASEAVADAVIEENDSDEDDDGW